MRVRRPLLAALTSVLLAFGLAGPVAPASAQGLPVVDQGHRIRIDGPAGYTKCTVGYVDRAKRRAVTASHCVMLPGMPVRNHNGQVIGTVMTPPMDVSPGQNDYAYIYLHSARPGRNSFSGDRIVHPSQVRPGERVCQVGATTQRVGCGQVYAVRGSAIFTHGAPDLRPGDSGGPAWIPGRGFVGVNSLVAPGGGGIKSAPFFYVGPDLLWPFALDLRRPVGPGNIVGSS